MESEEESILDFEFSEEELEEAITRKPKGGRPSNRTRELRARLKEAQEITDILGILRSGVLERLTEDNSRGFRPSDIRGNVPVNKHTKKQGFSPDGFSEELLLNLRLITPKFAEKNRKILGLSDEVLSDAMVKYAPIIAALAGVWVAEAQIKDFPQTLHLSIEILTKLLRLIDVLGNFVVDGLGGITDFVKDPVDTIRVALGGARIKDISEFPNLTPEEQDAFRQSPIGKQICSLPVEQQIELLGFPICGGNI